jgi:hypothetical protein
MLRLHNNNERENYHEPLSISIFTIFAKEQDKSVQDKIVIVQSVELSGKTAAVVVFHNGRIRRRQPADKPFSLWTCYEKIEQYGCQVEMQPGAAADESKLKGGRNYNAPSCQGDIWKHADCVRASNESIDGELIGHQLDGQCLPGRIK